jgi:ABC-type oligopeptide transport system ATPase subunit
MIPQKNMSREESIAPLLVLQGVKKYFPVQRGFLRRTVDYVKAVDNVSFHIGAGESVGLVGESGSGKSTVAQMAIRLVKPTAGEIHFLGENLLALSTAKLRSLRRHMQCVFQDPLVSLNPRKTIFENVGEAVAFHKLVENKEQQKAAVVDVLERVGLSAAALYQYPHQFSGGQQQRISIGRALVLKPKLLICDEITSALDLSVQAQVLNLLVELKESFQLSYLLISHDLSVVRHLCDRLLVMYRGAIVEQGDVETLFQHPQHPYTKNLLSSLERPPLIRIPHT